MVPRLARIDDWKHRKKKSVFLHSPTLKSDPMPIPVALIHPISNLLHHPSPASLGVTAVNWLTLLKAAQTGSAWLRCRLKQGPCERHLILRNQEVCQHSDM